MFVAGTSMLSIIVNDSGSPSLISDRGLRVAGLLVGAAISTLCHSTEQSSPTG
jgi:hypothetical protein